MWIAASRLYLGLHTPVDILAGAVAGLAVLVCFIFMEGGCLLLPACLGPVRLCVACMYIYLVSACQRLVFVARMHPSASACVAAACASRLAGRALL